MSRPRAFEGLNRGGHFAIRMSTAEHHAQHPPTPRASRSPAHRRDLGHLLPEHDAQVMKRRGLDYDCLRELKPDIIYVAQSGWATTDPPRLPLLRNVLARPVGLASMGGLPGPPPAGWSSPTTTTPGLGERGHHPHALHHRHRTGRGQFIDLAQTRSAPPCCRSRCSTGPSTAARSAAGMPERQPPPPTRRRRPTALPCRADDSWVAIACYTDEGGGPCARSWATALAGRPGARQRRRALRPPGRAAVAELGVPLHAVARRLDTRGDPFAWR